MLQLVVFLVLFMRCLAHYLPSRAFDGFDDDDDDDGDHHHHHFHGHHHRGNSCTGFSYNLEPKECKAWQALYDSTGGPTWDTYLYGGVNADMIVNKSTVRDDPCSNPNIVRCDRDGTTIAGLDLGLKQMKGHLPASMADFRNLRYLMLAGNNLTGDLPELNYKNFKKCGYKNCCFLSNTMWNVYDEAKDEPITNRFACPLPPDAVSICHASCINQTTGKLVRAHSFEEEISEAKGMELPFANHEAQVVNDPAACQKCKAASPKDFPQCDVHELLLFGSKREWKKGHIQGAYCTDKNLVVWADGAPNHGVFLEEMLHAPATEKKNSYLGVRLFNTQAYAYKIPLRPEYTKEVTRYTGAGALAMMFDGVSMYPGLGPNMTWLDPKTWEKTGHSRWTNMKLDGQLDRCNEHAGRGYDIHYHGNPWCMYNDTTEGHSRLIGLAGDGFGLYGPLNQDHLEPNDLDQCMGHVEDGLGYHYHTSPKFPYTIMCWHGKVSNTSWEPGGQPGEHQWAFDNAKLRSDYGELLPCCNETTGKAPFPIPWGLENVYPRHSESNTEAGQDYVWMYGLHPEGFDAPPAEKAPTTPGRCTGSSTSLVKEECDAWIDFWDATDGHRWYSCTAQRLDPCACLTQNGMVVCTGGHIIAFGLQANGLNGILPRSLANLTHLESLHLEGNAHGDPTRVGLHGQIPDNLAFSRFTACGLEGNRFSCPVPAAAVEHCSGGVPLSCEDDAVLV